MPDVTKPLHKPVLTHGQLNPQEQTSVKFESKCNNFHLRIYAFENVVCKISDIVFSFDILTDVIHLKYYIQYNVSIGILILMIYWFSNKHIIISNHQEMARSSWFILLLVSACSQSIYGGKFYGYMRHISLKSIHIALYPSQWIILVKLYGCR